MMTPWSRIPAGIVVLMGAAVLASTLREPGASTGAVTRNAEAQDAAAGNAGPHRYDLEYPAIHYSSTPLTDPVARLQERIDRGEIDLEYEEGHGFLGSLLEVLEIDTNSQALVFSRTSAQIPFISPATPRALYYSDEVYVGWPPDAPLIEISSMDPNLGPVFYTLAQDPRADHVRFERQMDECLRCHDTYSLTGGGVPRHLVGSGYTDNRGEQVSHEGWILVDDRTSLRFRWGGWYVTGTHGSQTHMGNWIIRDPEELRDIDLTRTGNVTDLSPFIETDRYLDPGSDIVALMVLDHQTRVQNVITRVNFETRTLMNQGFGDPVPELSEAVRDEIGTIAEPLVEALLMVGQPALTDPVTGTSGFAASFESRGPHDAGGRSLRELDLETRLFRYPVSYLIYSDAFRALPLPTRSYVYRRLGAILSGDDGSATFGHLPAEDRENLMEILLETSPEFRSFAAG